MTGCYRLGAVVFAIAATMQLPGSVMAAQAQIPQRRVLDPEVEAHLRSETGITQRSLLLLWAEGRPLLLESLRSNLTPGYREAVKLFAEKPATLSTQQRVLVVRGVPKSNRDFAVRVAVASLSEDDARLWRPGVNDLLIGVGIEELLPFSDEIAAALADKPLDDHVIPLLVRLDIPEVLRTKLLTRVGLDPWQRAALGDKEAERTVVARFDSLLQPSGNAGCQGSDLWTMASTVAWFRSEEGCKALARGLSSPAICDTSSAVKKAVAFDVLLGWMRAHRTHPLTLEYEQLLEVHKNERLETHGVQSPVMQAFYAKLDRHFQAECDAGVVIQVPAFYEYWHVLAPSDRELPR